MRDAIHARLRADLGALATGLADCLARASLAPEAAAFLRATFAADVLPGGAGQPPAPEGDVADAGAAHPIDRLASAFGFSALDRAILLFAALAEDHEGLAGILRGLHPRGEPRATPGLIAQAVCNTPADRLALREALECGRAVRSGAVRLTGEGPLPELSLELCPALWSALHGLDAWPAGLRPLDTSTLAKIPGIPAREAEIAARALAGSDPRTVLVWGDTEEAARLFAVGLAHHAGVPAACFHLAAGAPPETERLLALHAALRGLVPIVTASLPAQESSPGRGELPAFAAFPGPVALCAQHGAAPARSSRPVISVTVRRPTPLEREEMWRAALPELGPEAAVLAMRYRLDAASMASITTDVRAAADLQERAPRASDVAAAVSLRNTTAITHGLRLVRPAATWDHLVLPPDRIAQLREGVERLAHQARVLDEWRFLENRPGARGVRMLFAGPPGTGKTLAAEVLAAEIGVDLLIVDVSRVVSKWIGETEKNLASVFDVAERTQAALVFDEADALFGKRTEVSDAHDRYANLETAFLLSRIERFEGLVILTTNLRQNIDNAFLRRLEIVVDFQEPDVEERSVLWRRHIPEHAPLAPDLSLRELAALYPVVGGLIRNAAVAAGFLAAAERSAISRRHVIRALFREYEKSGRAFPGLPAGMTTF